MKGFAKFFKKYWRVAFILEPVRNENGDKCFCAYFDPGSINPEAIIEEARQNGWTVLVSRVNKYSFMFIRES